jgi:hypothetical protein
MPVQVSLPDLEANWNWPRRLNPHIHEISQECSDWAVGFKAFTPQAQKAFDKCNFSELGRSPWTTTRMNLGADVVKIF